MTKANRITSYEEFLEWVKTTKFKGHIGTRHDDTIAVASSLDTYIRTTHPRMYYQLQWILHGGHDQANFINGGIFNHQLTNASQRWWMLREYLRFALDEYSPIDDLIISGATYSHQLPLPAWHFLRMSPNNAGSVDFVYSTEDGLRDKVTTMSFGRYLTRYAPWLLNKHVQALESMLRADASNEFDVFMGAERIIHYYLNGPSSCMAKPWSDFEAGKHVLQAYDAPGWGIAVIRQNDEDRAAARSLVWINPKDENDKHYIRVYGDATLERRLRRAGFTNTIPTCAPLNYVEARDNQIMLPYFDGTNNNRALDGGHLFFDADRPYMLSLAEWNSRRANPALNRHLIQWRSTGIYTRANRFTGIRCRHCGTKDYASTTWNVALEMSVCPTCEKEQGYKRVRSFVDYRLGFFTLPECQLARVLSPNGTAEYIHDTEPTRARFEYIQYDPRFYPEDRRWAFQRDKTIVSAPDRPTRAWEVADVVTLVDGELNKQLLNRRANDFLPQKSWTKLTPRHRNDIIYATAEAKQHIRLTASGRKVIPGIHTVTRLLSRDEVWAPTSTVMEWEVFGARRGTVGDETLMHVAAELQLTTEEMNRALANVSTGYTLVEQLRRDSYPFADWLIPWHNPPRTPMAVNYKRHMGIHVALPFVDALLSVNNDEAMFTRFNAVTELERNAVQNLKAIWMKLNALHEERRAQADQNTSRPVFTVWDSSSTATSAVYYITAA